MAAAITKTVHLYSPTNKKTVDGLVVSPYQNIEQVLQGVRLAFSVKYAALYTVDAKPIASVETLHDDQRVLVAVTPSERMLPDAPEEFVLYNGEEGDEVSPDVEGSEQAWEDLTERETCDHITNLNEQKPMSRNKLRITRSYKSVQSDISAIETASPEYMALQTNISEANIEQRWRTTYDHFLPDAMRPLKFKISGAIWNPRTLAALDIFSSFTHGQSRLAREFLEEAVKMRIEDEEDAIPIVQFEDVVNAITIVYERAGVVPAKLTKPRSAKFRLKERKKALKEKKKAAGAKEKLSGVENGVTP